LPRHFFLRKDSPSAPLISSEYVRFLRFSLHSFGFVQDK